MEREEREKMERANTRAQKRALKDTIEAWWKVAKAEWEQQKEEHEKLISQLLAQGTACKDLPKGPTWQTKAQIQAIMEQEIGPGEGDESNNGDDEGEADW
jgi:hypothetical protein